eukprot:7847990-Lingulodinium_polyedra.AAC.1
MAQVLDRIPFFVREADASKGEGAELTGRAALEAKVDRLVAMQPGECEEKELNDVCCFKWLLKNEKLAELKDFAAKDAKARMVAEEQEEPAEGKAGKRVPSKAGQVAA